MLNVNEFIKSVHQNSVVHGWWESKRRTDEILALIHSELSEALEEYRAARGMVWYQMNEECAQCENHNEEATVMCVNECCDKNHKPEGIAVELIDACIRIFDYLGSDNCVLEGCETTDDLIKHIPDSEKELIKQDEVPNFIAYLHAGVSSSYFALDDEDHGKHIDPLLGVVAAICFWIKLKGYDPDDLLSKKHSYNITRPYKHGNKVC